MKIMVDDSEELAYTLSMKKFTHITWDEIVTQADTPDNRRELPRRLSACIASRKPIIGRRIPALDNMIGLCNAMGYDIMLVEKGKQQ